MLYCISVVVFIGYVSCGSIVKWLVINCSDKFVLETDDLFIFNKLDPIHWTFVLRKEKMS